MGAELTILGVAEASAEARLRAELSGVAGPALVLRAAGPLLGVAQRAGGARLDLFRGERAKALRRLHGAQRRLEIACQTGPFLPCDPSAARCAGEREFAALLDGARDALGAALAEHGARHQWEVALRWRAEDALAARRGEIEALAPTREPALLAEAVAAALRNARAERAAALRAALAPNVLALSPDDLSAGEAETGLVALVPANGEAAIEAALGALPEALTRGASCDLRGPLPPLSFAAFRVAETNRAALERAWETLGLPDEADGETLARHWRGAAARWHPDRGGGGDEAALRAAGEAHRLLRAVVGAGGRASRRALPAGRRLVAPEGVAP